MESQERSQQAMLADQKEQREWEKEKFDREMKVKEDEADIKREKVYIDADTKERDSQRKMDSNFNGISDEIDIKILENQKLKTKLEDDIKEKTLKETIRHNKETEKIDLIKAKKTGTSK